MPHEQVIPDEELIEDIQTAFGSVDGYLSRSKYGSIGEYGSSTVEKRFGGWGAAKEIAGVSRDVASNVKYPRLWDEQWVKSAYDEKDSTIRIADQLGCSRETVREALQRFGITRTPTMGCEKEEIECRVCSKTFSDYPSRNRRYCSQKCRSKNNPSGPNHPNWKGGTSGWRGASWKEQRKKALMRDRYTCQRCEIRKRINLHVHHIIPFRVFDDEKTANRLANLITVCGSCHMTIERNYEPVGWH